MKRHLSIFIFLFICGFCMNAQDKTGSQASSVLKSGLDSEQLELGVNIDLAKALYGRIAGLNVLEGAGASGTNVNGLRYNGVAPLIIVDGFPRSLSDLVVSEIETIEVLKDAASLAIYGTQGGNGVILITTKRGKVQPFNVNADFKTGWSMISRAPQFADSYVYANCLNEALVNDGFLPKYNNYDLEAFRTGSDPYNMPDVNWWDETFRDYGLTHRMDLTFNGGSSRFRYFVDVLYYRDRSLLDFNTQDSRYNSKNMDTRLQLRTNLDVDVTRTTLFRLNLVGKMQEKNGPIGMNKLFTNLYSIPSAVFPVKHANGVYGGSLLFDNPVSTVRDKGQYKTLFQYLIADGRLTQKLDMLTPGLYLEAGASFDNTGAVYELASKKFMTQDNHAFHDLNGNLVINPTTIGADNPLLYHEQAVDNLHSMSTFYARAGYDRHFDRHHVTAKLQFEQQSFMAPEKNSSYKRQQVLTSVGYSFADKYLLDAVLSYAGTAYLPKGDRFKLYPAISASWILSNESFMKDCKAVDFMKLALSYGASGYDRNMEYDLYRHNYVKGQRYFFGDNATSMVGMKENKFPSRTLAPEKTERLVAGLEMRLFGNRLGFNVDGYLNKVNNILINANTSVSGVIGNDMNKISEGINQFSGVNVNLNWNDKVGDFFYGLDLNFSYMKSKIIKDGQAYQEYPWLFTKGNEVDQTYGLETSGFFNSQAEIDASPVQQFGAVQPGDLKYVDQNQDGRIDSQDVVPLGNGRLPNIIYGFNLNFGYKNFRMDANFQGRAMVSVNLLDSPLYKPLLNNSTISNNYLNHEIPWTAKNADVATMPRLTTLENLNNMRNSSHWFRDGSFFKLRNLRCSYTFDRNLLKFFDMQVYLQANDLFSIDHVRFANPEHLEACYPSTTSIWLGLNFNF